MKRIAYLLRRSAWDRAVGLGFAVLLLACASPSPAPDSDPAAPAVAAIPAPAPPTEPEPLPAELTAEDELTAEELGAAPTASAGAPSPAVGSAAMEELAAAEPDPAPPPPPPPPPTPAGVAAEAPPPAPAEPPAAPAEPSSPVATAFWASTGQTTDAAQPWTRLATDGIHDPASAALQYLQDPQEALAELPRGKAGDYIEWNTALRAGLIEPRASLDGTGRMEVLDLEVVLADTKTMPSVTFPHRTHTEWLACKNCHDAIFLPKRGANPIAMTDIFAGKYCGTCHGKVAFPLAQCFLCHNGPRPGMTSSSTTAP